MNRCHRIFIASILVFFLPAVSCRAELPLDQIKLPPGFSIEIYTDQVPGARSLARGTGGVLFVGTRDQGKVYAVMDSDGKGGKIGKTVVTLARGLNMPNGVAFRDGDLYVAEISRILKFPDVEHNLRHPGKPVVITDSLPTDRHHGWKFIRFGPDGLLYVPVGAPCNICDPGDPYAAILRMQPDGSGREIYARGVRNTVGFDWQPSTKELWFTDNGRDWLGDNRPPDELNHAPRAGLHFGFPYRHGRDVIDPEYGSMIGDRRVTPPALELSPHVAALGMRFYTGAMFPQVYQGQIFIAEHGSWNRSEPIGYRIVAVELAGGKVISNRIFAQGWLQGSRAWGRPVDLLVMPDGSLLVSDDKAGALYRISYKDEQADEQAVTSDSLVAKLGQ